MPQWTFLAALAFAFGPLACSGCRKASEEKAGGASDRPQAVSPEDLADWSLSRGNVLASVAPETCRV